MVTYCLIIDDSPATTDDHVVDDDDHVFKALADRTRRALLDALFVSDGQTLGSLCARLPSMTRFGVMKHLAVLEDAGLVVTHREGRTKLHYVNAVPIRAIQDRWIDKYARPVATSLVGLRTHLEDPFAGAG